MNSPYHKPKKNLFLLIDIKIAPCKNKKTDTA